MNRQAGVVGVLGALLLVAGACGGGGEDAATKQVFDEYRTNIRLVLSEPSARDALCPALRDLSGDDVVDLLEAAINDSFAVSPRDRTRLGDIVLEECERLTGY